MRRLLRDETRGVHARIERSAFSRLVVDGGLDEQVLARQLTASRAVWVEVARTSRYLLPELWVDSMDRVPLIDADLEVLRTTFQVQTVAADAAEPVVSWWASGPGRSAAAGFLYVLEGASLGGLVIAKHLEAQGFGSATQACRPYGRLAGPAVQRFCARLEQGGFVADEVVQGARAGFERMHAMLDAVGHPLVAS